MRRDPRRTKMLLVSPVSSRSQRFATPIWLMTIILAAIGLLVAVRRVYVLLSPAKGGRGFAAAAALDQGFGAHSLLTLFHIVPAALLIVLMPLQFVERIRVRY